MTPQNDDAVGKMNFFKSSFYNMAYQKKELIVSDNKSSEYLKP